jgi:hypothetical protein
MRSLLLIFCLLLATGCDENSPTGPTVPLDERFTLAPGDTAVIADTDTRVQFLRVSGDSRCPGDAVCIQGGDALVHVRVYGDKAPVEYELHTGDASQASVTHGGLKIALQELQPYPFGSLPPIAAGDYRATLSVTRP